MSDTFEPESAQLKRLCDWAISLSLPTGHADTVDDLLAEVGGHIRELQERATAELAAAEALLTEIAQSGVEMDDSRLSYVVVQIDYETWHESLAALREEG